MNTNAANQLIDAGVIDAGDVYDIPAVCDGKPPVSKSPFPYQDGWWLVDDSEFIGPFTKEAEAHEFADGCSLDDPFEPVDPENLAIIHVAVTATTIKIN